MTTMQFPALITLAIALLLFAVMINVGRQRIRCKIDAPATTGHPMLERAFRVQMNTIENVVLVLPLLWVAAFFHDPLRAAVVGLVWLLARIWYAVAYMKDPKTRGPGFSIAALAAMVLLGMGLWGVVRQCL